MLVSVFISVFNVFPMKKTPPKISPAAGFARSPGARLWNPEGNRRPFFFPFRIGTEYARSVLTEHRVRGKICLRRWSCKERTYRAQSARKDQQTLPPTAHTYLQSTEREERSWYSEKNMKKPRKNCEKIKFTIRKKNFWGYKRIF